MPNRSIYRSFALLLCTGVAAMLVVSCSVSEELENVRERLRKDFERSGVYERGNLPSSPSTPSEDDIKGYFDIIDGAFRHVTNEFRATRGDSPMIGYGDRISFYFDARVYNGGFDSQSSPTFYTNIKSRMEAIAAGNNEINTGYWSTDPLVITLGDDPQILKIVQTALVGCRADNGTSADDGEDMVGGVVSDIVRIYLPYDVGFKNSWVYNVPPRSTIAFEITGIQLLN